MSTAANISRMHGRAATDTSVSKASTGKSNYCFLLYASDTTVCHRCLLAQVSTVTQAPDPSQAPSDMPFCVQVSFHAHDTLSQPRGRFGAHPCTENQRQDAQPPYGVTVLQMGSKEGRLIAEGLPPPAYPPASP